MTGKVATTKAAPEPVVVPTLALGFEDAQAVRDALTTVIMYRTGTAYESDKNDAEAKLASFKIKVI